MQKKILKLHPLNIMHKSIYIQGTRYMTNEIGHPLNFLNGTSIETMETITNCVMDII